MFAKFYVTFCGKKQNIQNSNIKIHKQVAILSLDIGSIMDQEKHLKI